ICTNAINFFLRPPSVCARLTWWVARFPGEKSRSQSTANHVRSQLHFYAALRDPRLGHSRTCTTDGETPRRSVRTVSSRRSSFPVPAAERGRERETDMGTRKRFQC